MYQKNRLEAHSWLQFFNGYPLGSFTLCNIDLMNEIESHLFVIKYIIQRPKSASDFFHQHHLKGLIKKVVFVLCTFSYYNSVISIQN